MIKDAWSALQALPASAYLGLATPRFLLRMPYGRKTDPVDAFAFEEFTRASGLSGMVWGHPALIPALLLAQGWSKAGAKLKLGTGMVVGDMPTYVYTDPDGDQIALPCTERLYSERQAVQVATYNVMPLLSLRGRTELRLGGFASLAGTPLAGVWAPVEIAPGAPASRPQAEETSIVAEPALPEAAPEDAPQDAPDLDALLAGLDAPAPEAAPAADDDLDALLASLSAPPPAAAAGETEPDLDALLASLA